MRYLASSSRRFVLLALAAGTLAAAGGSFWVFRHIRTGARQAGLPEIEKLIAEGDIARALEEVGRELSLHPADPSLLSTAVRLRFQIGDYRTGEEWFRRLIANAARPAESWVALARLREDASLSWEAARDAERALQIDPEIAGARAILGRSHLTNIRFEEARDLLAPRVAAGSADREELLVYGRGLLRLGHHREAADVLDRALALPAAVGEDRPDSTEGGVSGEARTALAEALIGGGDFQQAADGLSELLEEEPFLGRAYYLLGTALARTGRRDSAGLFLKVYEGLSRADGRWSKTREMDRAGVRNRASYERASIYAETNRFRRALSECRRAVSLTVSSKIEDGQVLLATAKLLADFEAAAEARETLERAISKGIEPAADFLCALGELRRRAGQMKEAREAFERALASSPQDMEALVGRGRVALEGGERPEAAESFLARARALDPREREPVYWLARAVLERGDAVEARSLLLEARRLGEGMDAELLYGMGLTALRGGAREEAGKLFLESLKIDPRSVEALRGLEEGMAGLGDPARAAKAKELRRKVEEVQALLARLRSSPGRFEGRGAAFLEIAERCRAANLTRDALKYLHLARESSPESPAAYRALAAQLVAPEEAFFKAQALESLLRIEPGNALARRDLALLLAQVGVRLERAHELAREAQKTEDSPEGHYVLGEVLLARGDLEGAAREAQAAIQGKPGEARFQKLAERARPQTAPEDKR